MGDDATYLKLEAHKEKMQTVEVYKAREQALEDEITALATRLADEKDHVLQNQQMTNRILVTRVELDSALGKLKKQYEQESKEWQSKIAAQQEAYNYNLSKLAVEQETQNRDLMSYEQASKELESKLSAQQEAHNRDVMKYEQVSKELENKLTAEQEARNRDLNMLTAEQEAHQRDTTESQEVSNEFECNLAVVQGPYSHS